jgi:hypothetical protein
LRPTIDRGDILEALEQVQPYAAQDVVPYDGSLTDHRLSLLWQLRCLNNIDKHRLLLVMLCVPNIDNMWWGTSEGEVSPEIAINWAALKDGSPVAWFDFHGAQPPDDFDPHPAVQVVLNEAETPRLTASGVTNALGVFVWQIEDYILNLRFRPLFA